MNSPLRVAIFTETFLPKLDGIVSITCLLLDHLKQIGAEALVISPGKHVAQYPAEDGYPVISIQPSIPLPIYPELRMAIPGKKTFRALAEFHPTVIHLINPWLSGLRGIRYARRLDVPLVMSFHTHMMDMAQFYRAGIFKKPLWSLHRHFYRKADYRLATSKRIVAELEAHGFGPTGLWRRGVDIDQFSPDYRSDAMRHRLTDGHPERLLLLFVGRVAPEKQVEQLRYVLGAVPGTHLAIVGDGPHRKKVETLLRGHSVTFTGYMTGRELSEAYASSDLFVFPSAVETFGLVVAEAMATGLPVVTSNVGGVSDIIEPGVDGFIFEPNDIDRMVSYVRMLAADPQKRAAVGQQARQAVRSLAWPVIMDELVAIYRDLSTAESRAHKS